MKNRVGDRFIDQPAALIELNKTKGFLLSNIMPEEERKYGRSVIYYRYLFMCEGIDIAYQKVSRMTGNINMSTVTQLIDDYTEEKLKEHGIYYKAKEWV